MERLVSAFEAQYAQHLTFTFIQKDVSVETVTDIFAACMHPRQKGLQAQTSLLQTIHWDSLIAA